MSQSSTHMLCSTFVSAKIRHGNLKTSVFNFCGSMLPGFADFNAKNNKKNLHDCNEYMNNDELRNTLKFSQLSRYANKQVENSELEVVTENVAATTSNTEDEPTNEIQSPPNPQKRISGKQRKATLEEYQQTFLQVPRIDDRKPVFVSSDVRDRLDRVVRILGGRRMSVSGIIENIVRHHLSLYEEDFEAWRKL